MFNVLHSIDKLDFDEFRELKSYKFSSTTDVINHIGQLLMYLKDTLLGFSSKDSAILDTLFTEKLKRMLTIHRNTYEVAKKYDFAINYNNLRAFPGSLMEIDKCIIDLCDAANEIVYMYVNNVEKAADRARDLYLELSDNEISKLNSMINSLNVDALKRAMIHIIENNFTIESVIYAAIQLNIPLLDMRKLLIESIIPMLGGEYKEDEDSDTHNEIESKDDDVDVEIEDEENENEEMEDEEVDEDMYKDE